LLVEGECSFLLIAKVAEIIALATQAPVSDSEVIQVCERLFKQAKHLAIISEQLIRLCDETFEVLVILQYILALQGEVEAIDSEVSLISMSFL
jgi:hypothetical protein